MQSLDPVLLQLAELAGILAPLLAIVIPIVLGRYENRKRLACEVLAAAGMVVGLPKVQVTFNGQVVPDPHSCTIRIRNVGTTQIVSKDYEKPVRIRFPPCANHPHGKVKVVTYMIIDRTPETLTPQLSLGGDGEITFDPILLNPEDSFTIHVLLDSCFDRELDLDARIVGLKHVQVQGEPEAPSFRLFTGTSALLIILGSLALLGGGEAFGLSYIAMGVFVLFWIYRAQSNYRYKLKQLGLAP